MKAINITTPVNNQGGYAMVVTMLILVLLTLIGIAATQTSNIEVAISGNNKKIVEDFYTAEGALFEKLEQTDWLTETFINAGTAGAGWKGDVDVNDDGTDDATVEIRCVDSDGTIVISGLSGNANDVPLVVHIGPPPAESGYSLRYFNIRRYAFTATTLPARTDVQAGAWKVFNRF
jgi:Tfp pilus assembly protein PilX